MFLVTLVLFGKNPFEPMCLFVSEPLIDERGMLTNDKFLATTITPECPHFLETCCSLSALPLPYCHSLHQRQLLQFEGSSVSFGRIVASLWES